MLGYKKKIHDDIRGGTINRFNSFWFCFILSVSLTDVL